MTKLTIIPITTIALAGVALSLWIQHLSHARNRASDGLLQAQRAQLAALTAEHERLANLAAHASSLPAEDHSAEVARLRREAEALKQQTNELAGPSAKSHAPSAARSAASTETPQEKEERLRQVHSALRIATAFGMYASDHQNQFALNFDQLAPYLAKPNTSVPENDQFEIVYQGSLDKLQGIPLSSVAVVRSLQTWPGPDGKLIRVYGMMDGHVIQVGSDDNFQSWEAQHVIAPPADGASGQ
jgi:hypothetical protein